MSPPLSHHDHEPFEQPTHHRHQWQRQRVTIWTAHSTGACSRASTRTKSQNRRWQNRNLYTPPPRQSARCLWMRLDNVWCFHDTYAQTLCAAYTSADSRRGRFAYAFRFSSFFSFLLFCCSPDVRSRCLALCFWHRFMGITRETHYHTVSLIVKH